jgi:hypothetical protein
MFKVLNEIKQKEMCSTVSFDKEYLSFSEGSYLKIYNRYEIASIDYDLDPTYRIRANEDIVYAKFNHSGDSMNI